MREKRREGNNEMRRDETGSDEMRIMKMLHQLGDGSEV